MRSIPYLHFENTCREAFAFRQRTSGGELEAMETCGESPMCARMPAESRHVVLHARLRVGTAYPMGPDGPRPADATLRTCISIVVDPVGEAERIGSGLAEGATVPMPLQATYRAQRRVMLLDRHGQQWMVGAVALPAA